MATKGLQQLGLTELESDIYLALLTKGAMTGYAVAKDIGKPVANVYKALDSLAGKGAAVQAQQDRKLYKATPWRDLLAEAERRQQDVLRNLARDLAAIPEPGEDEEVYQLTNADQVIATGHRLIEEAEQILLADLEPSAVSLYADALKAAAARGVEVRIKTYQPVNIPGVQIITRLKGEEVYARTPDVRFKIAVDGRSFLNALLSVDMDAVIQAFTSGSALMGMSIYSGLLYELVLTDIKRLAEGDDFKGIQQLLEDTRHLHPFSSRNSVLDVFTARYHNAP